MPDDVIGLLARLSRSSENQESSHARPPDIASEILRHRVNGQ